MHIQLPHFKGPDSVLISAANRLGGHHSERVPEIGGGTPRLPACALARGSPAHVLIHPACMPTSQEREGVGPCRIPGYPSPSQGDNLQQLSECDCNMLQPSSLKHLNTKAYTGMHPAEDRKAQSSRGTRKLGTHEHGVQTLSTKASASQLTRKNRGVSFASGCRVNQRGRK